MFLLTFFLYEVFINLKLGGTQKSQIVSPCMHQLKIGSGSLDRITILKVEKMVFRSHLVCVFVCFFNDLKLFASHFLVSESGLGLRDINLDAVRTLRG